MQTLIYQHIRKSSNSGKKLFALLIDPDKHTPQSLLRLISAFPDAKPDLLFVGGSLLSKNNVEETVRTIKSACEIPVILFPGSTMQFTEEADALLFLSLISGRNADLLIGRHVEIAPMLKQSQVEVLPTGYMLIDAGAPTTASYISNTFPIPHNKADVAACTAMAGELLGLKLIYLDAGSGASRPVSPEMISTVRQHVQVPIIVGGGIRNEAQMNEALEAGADVAVVGNAIEANADLLQRFCSLVRSFNQKSREQQHKAVSLKGIGA